MCSRTWSRIGGRSQVGLDPFLAGGIIGLMIQYQIVNVHRHGLGQTCPIGGCAGPLPGGVGLPGGASCPPGYASVPGPNGARCLNTTTGEEYTPPAETPAQAPVQASAPAPTSAPIQTSAPPPVTSESAAPIPAAPMDQGPTFPQGPSYPVVNQAPTVAQPLPAPAPPLQVEELEPATIPEDGPKWVQAGTNDLATTLAATGTVAALAIAGLALLK